MEGGERIVSRLGEGRKDATMRQVNGGIIIDSRRVRKVFVRWYIAICKKEL